MTCEAWRDRLVEAALGGVADPGLRGHLEECSSCAGELRRLQGIVGALREEPEDPSWLEAETSILAPLLQRPRKPRRPAAPLAPLALLRRRLPAYAAILLFALGMGLGWLSGRGADRSREKGATPEIVAPEAPGPKGRLAERFGRAMAAARGDAVAVPDTAREAS
jgi:hypothetical protein